MSANGQPANPHPFEAKPNRTLLGLSWPVLGALIAEPLTALVDTGFVARLGSLELAALGIGAAILSGSLWIFNFLAIGTQSRVAQSSAGGDLLLARRYATTALAMSLLCGTLAGIALGVFAAPISRLMGASDPTLAAEASAYLQIRAIGLPAVLVMLTSAGALRGLEDMKSPLYVALGANAINLLLDPVLIFGMGRVGAMGLEGAAWASTSAFYAGAVATVAIQHRRLALRFPIERSSMLRLLVVGRDLFLRTTALTFFLLVATRAAVEVSTAAGAAHQVIRQVWIFSALFLDAFAVAGQTLVAQFLGRSQLAQARRAARYVCSWSAATGLVLGASMLMLTPVVGDLLVPKAAQSAFLLGWITAAAFQPINALSFATDGIHWASEDFAFLRDAIAIATGTGVAMLWLLPIGALHEIWLITSLWIAIRAGFGMVRIWPGFGNAPLR